MNSRKSRKNNELAIYTYRGVVNFMYLIAGLLLNLSAIVGMINFLYVLVILHQTRPLLLFSSIFFGFAALSFSIALRVRKTL